MEKDADQALLKMGDITRLSGLSARAVRHYEQLGLLHPAKRTPGGYRIFEPDTLQRLSFIRQAQALGFTLEAIRGLLRAQHKGDPGCTLAREHMRMRAAELAELLQSLLAQQAHLQVFTQPCERCEGSCSLLSEVASVERRDPHSPTKLNSAANGRPMDIGSREVLTLRGNYGEPECP